MGRFPLTPRLEVASFAPLPLGRFYALGVLLQTPNALIGERGFPSSQGPNGPFQKN